MPVIGCIGCGNMGGALMRGFAATLDPEKWTLRGYNRSPEKMAPLRQVGVLADTSIGEVAANSDILVFAVKPYQMEAVLREAGKEAARETIAISIAAGFSLKSMREALGGNCLACRCMPTTTALVGRGVFAFCFGETAPRTARDEIMDLFGLLGYCLELPESRITDFSALIGAGPAYVFGMMAALAQAGLSLGFTHAQSVGMIAELFAGCAEMAKDNTKHLMEMRDEVCSPGGLTIAGVNVLDRAGLAGIVVEAVMAAARRGRQMES